MELRKSSQEMPVPATDLQHKSPLPRHHRSTRGAQGDLAFSDSGLMLGGSKRGFHGDDIGESKEGRRMRLFLANIASPDRFNEHHQHADVGRIDTADAAGLAQRKRLKCGQLLRAFFSQTPDGEIV